MGKLKIGYFHADAREWFDSHVYERRDLLLRCTILYLEYLWFVLRCTALEEGKDIIGSFPSKDFFPRRNQTLGGSLDLLDHHPESLVDMHKYEEGVGTHTSLGPTCL